MKSYHKPSDEWDRKEKEWSEDPQLKKLQQIESARAYLNLVRVDRDLSDKPSAEEFGRVVKEKMWGTYR